MVKSQLASVLAEASKTVFPVWVWFFNIFAFGVFASNPDSCHISCIEHLRLEGGAMGHVALTKLKLRGKIVNS